MEATRLLCRMSPHRSILARRDQLPTKATDTTSDSGRIRHRITLLRQLYSSNLINVWEEVGISRWGILDRMTRWKTRTRSRTRQNLFRRDGQAKRRRRKGNILLFALARKQVLEVNQSRVARQTRLRTNAAFEANAEIALIAKVESAEEQAEGLWGGEIGMRGSCCRQEAGEVIWGDIVRISEPDSSAHIEIRGCVADNGGQQSLLNGNATMQLPVHQTLDMLS